MEPNIYLPTFLSSRRQSDPMVSGRRNPPGDNGQQHDSRHASPRWQRQRFGRRSDVEPERVFFYSGQIRDGERRSKLEEVVPPATRTGSPKWQGG